MSFIYRPSRENPVWIMVRYKNDSNRFYVRLADVQAVSPGKQEPIHVAASVRVGGDWYELFQDPPMLDAGQVQAAVDELLTLAGRV